MARLPCQYYSQTSPMPPDFLPWTSPWPSASSGSGRRAPYRHSKRDQVEGAEVSVAAPLLTVVKHLRGEKAWAPARVAECLIDFLEATAGTLRQLASGLVGTLLLAVKVYCYSAARKVYPSRAKQWMWEG